MAVPTSINDLSTTAGSNAPSGSDAPSQLDDVQRAHASFIAVLRDGLAQTNTDLSTASTSVRPIVYGGTGAATASAARTSLGSTTVGDAVFIAATQAAARQAIGLPGTGQLAGLRNLVINGNFNLNPRGYVSGTATTVANQYTLGMWRVVTSGQSLTFTPSGNGNLVTFPAGGGEQVIEGASIGGGTHVVSWTGTGTCSVNGTARAKGETFTLAANTSATVKLVGQIGKFQLEPGEVFTGFDERPVSLETLLLSYYIRKLANITLTGYQQAGSAVRQFIPLSPPMRTTPTTTVTAGTLLNTTSPVTSFASTSGFCLDGAAIGTGAFSIQADVLLSSEP